MTAADKIQAARALIEPLTGHTPGPYHNAGIPTAAGRVIADASPKRAHIGSAYKAADVRLFAAAPALRDTVAALAAGWEAEKARADALAQENERLLAVLREVSEAETPNGNATVRRMGSIARAALEATP